MLAHKAEHEGVVCVEAIKGLKPHPIDKLKIPGCTYCNPQIASVGLTEAKAKEAGREVKVGRFPFIGNGKAIALGEPEGLVKTIFDAKTGQLLGAHMVGAEVTELIQGFVVAMNLETTEEELIDTRLPAPDALRDDARERARRLWAGHPRIEQESAARGRRFGDGRQRMEGVGWIMTIILGGLAGWIAEKVMKSEMGLIGNIILGIIGALVLNAILRGARCHPAGRLADRAAHHRHRRRLHPRSSAGGSIRGRR